MALPKTGSNRFRWRRSPAGFRFGLTGGSAVSWARLRRSTCIRSATGDGPCAGFGAIGCPWALASASRLRASVCGSRSAIEVGTAPLDDRHREFDHFRVEIVSGGRKVRDQHFVGGSQREQHHARTAGPYEGDMLATLYRNTPKPGPAALGHGRRDHLERLNGVLAVGLEKVGRLQIERVELPLRQEGGKVDFAGALDDLEGADVLRGSKPRCDRARFQSL